MMVSEVQLTSWNVFIASMMSCFLTEPVLFCAALIMLKPRLFTPVTYNNYSQLIYYLENCIDT